MSRQCPAATASWGSSMGAKIMTINLIHTIIIGLLWTVLHVLLFRARMRAMVSCSYSVICWADLAAVWKSSHSCGSRRRSTSALYWTLSLVGHSWLWLLIKNLCMEARTDLQVPVMSGVLCGKLVEEEPCCALTCPDIVFPEQSLCPANVAL